MSYSYDKAVFIGRMQPFHIGHLVNIRKALEVGEQVIIILGSSKRARSPKNPFSDAERIAMVKASLTPDEVSRIKFVPIADNLYSDTAWIAAVQQSVMQMQEEKVALVGHNKDGDGRHLEMFQAWDFVDSELVCKHEGMPYHASDFRKDMFEMGGVFPDKWQDVFPESVYEMIKSFMSSDIYKELVSDYCYYKNYPKEWGVGPHLTTDAVVVSCGHVLMVERGANPGKGTLALPGGFLNPEETFLEGMLRKLKEETKIKVPPGRLMSEVKEWNLFDHPKRSLRGRVITNAAYIPLSFKTGLPRVKGGDDAAKAMWVSLAEIEQRQEEIYEDHYSIIKYFVK